MTENSMTRTDTLAQLAIWTTKELALRSDDQLAKIYEILSDKYGQGEAPLIAPVNPVVVDPVVASERLVSLYVSPVMQICDEKYSGQRMVTEAVATQLIRMMQQHQFRETKNQQFIDHGVRNHGEFK